jgi:serine/threonine-protein kinase HipA
MTLPRIKELALHTTQGIAGRLIRESQFVVRYNDDALARPALAISLTMPPRPDGWRSNPLPPVLAQNLPEGFLLNRTLERYRKVMDVNDDMSLLALTSTSAAGRVWASAPDSRREEDMPPIALRDILAYRGTEELFDDLLERYGSTSISGVQPKVVVPEQLTDDRNADFKSSLKSPDLIVKFAGDDYPGLAENEFHCMSIARLVGLRTPEFHLSDDARLFVIRRFDLGPGGYLGFEDLATLTGRHTSRKYDGSYSEVARAVAENVAPMHRARSLAELFKLIVLDCVVRNGDAHLKNFGVLYGDPASADDDAILAPVYDVVCTTMYLKGDSLALGLAGTKAWPNRKTLEKFGAKACDVPRPGRVVDEVIDGAMQYRPAEPSSPLWKSLRLEIEQAAQALRVT